MQLKKIISLLLFTVPYQAIPHWKGKKLNFQKKKNFGLRKPIIFRPKNKQGIFLHDYFLKNFKECNFATKVVHLV